MYQALYRRYRPAAFADVVGQERITTVLSRQVAAHTAGHAYLFTGPRGTGKTTCAKILANAVNCEAPRDGDPCGECAFCRAAATGDCLDVVEIDAASNNGVDYIRSLREEATYTPVIGRFRVYIIDEVHMLSASAFNALLKTLEEPPAHVIFILATTELHKVPATIVSRCQRFDFRRIEGAVIAERLRLVAEKEGLTLAPEAARLLARLADGGLRDALSLLEVCAAPGEPITAALVAQIVGVADDATLYSLTDALLAADAAAALALADAELAAHGDPARLCERLIGHFRALTLCKSVREPAELLDTEPEALPALRRQAGLSTLPALLAALSELQEAAARMPRSAYKRTTLETALLRVANPAFGARPEALAARITALEADVRALFTLARGQAEAGAPFPVQAEAAAEPPMPTEDIVPSAEQTSAAALPPQTKAAAAPPVQTSTPAPALPTKPAAESPPSGLHLLAEWEQVLARLRELHPGVGGMLSGTSAYYDGKRVLIDCRDTFFLQMMQNNPIAREQIKQAIAQTLGRRCAIGPYRREEAQENADPLEGFISKVQGLPGVTIK